MPSISFYPSLEVRWFFPGPLPDAVVSWFADTPHDPPACRTDRYLLLPDQDALGLKLREGRFEAKNRCKRLGVRQLAERAWGRIEHWRKWSFPLEDDAPPLAQPEAAWLAVEKTRSLRTYGIVDGRPVVRNGEAELDRGCGLEITEVRAAGATWWTLGFEAFGPEPTLGDTFQTVVGRVFEQPVPVPLPAGASYSYPCWFLRLPTGPDKASPVLHAP